MKTSDKQPKQLSLQDLLKELSLLKSPQEKIEIIKSSLDRVKPLTSESITTIIKEVSSKEQDRSTAVLALLNQKTPGNKGSKFQFGAKTLNKILDQFQGNENKTKIITAFLNNTNTNIDQLIEVMKRASFSGFASIIKEIGSKYGDKKKVTINFLKNTQYLQGTIDELFDQVLNPAELNEEEKNEAIGVFLKNINQDVTVGDFITIIKKANFTQYDYKENIIKTFLENRLSKKHITIDHLFDIIKISNFQQKYGKGNIIDFFLSDINSKVTVDQLFDIIKKSDIKEDDSKSDIIKYFLENPNNPNNKVTADQLLKIIKGADIKEQRSKNRIIEFFLKDPNNPNNKVTVDQLLSIIKGADIKEERNKNDIIKSFLVNSNNPNNKVTADQLLKIIKDKETGIKKDENKSDIIKSFLENPNNHNNKVTVNQLLSIIKGADIKEDFHKSYATGPFLRNPNNPNSKVTVDELFDIIKKFDIKEDDGKSYAVRSFLGNLNNSHNRVNVNEFLNITKKSDIKEDDSKSYIIQSFLGNSNNPNNKVTADQLLKIIKETVIKEDDNKSDIIKSFLENPNNHNNKVTADQLLSIIKGADIKEQRSKNDIIQFFLKDPNNLNNKVTVDQLLSIIEGADIKEEPIKNNIIHFFLKDPNNPNNKVTADQLLKIIKETVIKEDDNKSDIIKSFLENPNNHNNKVTADQLLKIIKGANLNEQYSISTIQSFLKNYPDQSFSLLKQIIGSPNFGNLRYRIDIMYNLYIGISSNTSPADQAKQLSEIATALYTNNEHLQIDFLQYAINRKLITKDNIAFLDLKIIKDDSAVLRLLEHAEEKKLFGENREKLILELVKGRTHAKYDFLKKMISDGSLKENLTEVGLKDVNSLFTEEYLQKNNITISDLFSYYDLTSNLSGLSKILKPEIKKELQETFHPSDKILIVKPEEITKLAVLLDINEVAMKDKFISNDTLCNYFLNKKEIKNIKQLTKEEIKDYIIDFKDTAFAEKKELPILSNLKGKELINLLINKIQKINPDDAQDQNTEKFKSILKKRMGANLKSDLNIVKGIKFEKIEFLESLRAINLEENIDSDNELIKNIKDDLTILLDPNNSNSQLATQNKETLRGQQEDLNKLFRSLLEQDNPNEDGVAEFFSTALSIDLVDIDNNKGKLTQFFNANKKELAYFFAGGGLGELAGIMISLRDGCSKNIGTQFTTLLYQSLLKDNPSDPILFQLLRLTIIPTILNKHGGDVIGNENNPLSNITIKSYFLSPEALIKEIAKSFYNPEMKEAIIKDSWEFIGRVLGDDDLKTIIGDKIKYDNQMASEVAAYLTLKNTKDKIIEEKIDQSFLGKEIKNLIYIDMPNSSVHKPSQSALLNFTDKEIKEVNK